MKENITEYRRYVFERPRILVEKSSGRIIAMYEPNVSYGHVVVDNTYEISDADREKLLYNMDKYKLSNGKIVERTLSPREISEKEIAEKEAIRSEILRSLEQIDKKRIRPLAEGDAERLAQYNAEAEALRARLRNLK